jgi:hypothetical protein
MVIYGDRHGSNGSVGRGLFGTSEGNLFAGHTRLANRRLPRCAGGKAPKGRPTPRYRRPENRSQGKVEPTCCSLIATGCRSGSAAPVALSSWDARRCSCRHTCRISCAGKMTAPPSQPDSSTRRLMRYVGRHRSSSSRPAAKRLAHACCSASSAGRALRLNGGRRESARSANRALKLNHIPGNHCDRNHDNQDQQHDAHVKTDFVDPSTHWVRLVCQRSPRRCP